MAAEQSIPSVTAIRSFLLAELDSLGVLDADKRGALSASSYEDLEMDSLHGVDLATRAAARFGLDIAPKSLAREPSTLCSLNDLSQYLSECDPRDSSTPSPQED